MAIDPTGTMPQWLEKLRDWSSTILGLLNPVSKVFAAGSLIVAAIQGKGADIKADWDNGCFNPFNMNADVALNSKVFSFYKGESVIRHNIPYTTSCQILGNIFLNVSETATNSGRIALNHEYGHSIQERGLGIKYITRVAIPSLITFFLVKDDKIYFSMPWERTADWFGGVNRSTGYKNGSLGWSFAEINIGLIVIPFYFIFGF